jgi:hypothetical protein
MGINATHIFNFIEKESTTGWSSYIMTRLLSWTANSPQNSKKLTTKGFYKQEVGQAIYYGITSKTQEALKQKTGKMEEHLAWFRDG